jgi:hypothetical protein
VKKLKESSEAVAEREMPPWFYLPVHRDAELTTEDRAVLRPLGDRAVTRA